MKAMILAAGRGERMRPLTDSTPKPLLPIDEHCLIEHHLFNLHDAGFEEVVINVAWLGQQIIDTLGSGEKYGLNIVFSNEGEQALETGGGILNALPLLGDEPFLVINGDVWTDYPVQQLRARALTAKAHLVLVNNPPHHPQGDFGIKEGLLQDDVQHKFTYSGIGIYSADFFQQNECGKFPLAPMIRQYISQQQISGEVYQGAWWDIGTPQRLQHLQQFLSQRG